MSDQKEQQPKEVTPAIPSEPPKEVWLLKLYVAGQTAKSISAFTNLKKVCEERLQGQYRIEVIDLLANPELAQGDQILAIPTVVRDLPHPVKKIIGDLSNMEKVLIGLDLKHINKDTSPHNPGEKP